MIDQLAEKFPVKIWMLDWHPSDHEIPIHSHRNLTVDWVEPNAVALLEKAQQFSWDGWFPHLICEAKILLKTRRYLLKEVGISKDLMHAQAYWIKGKAMGSDRDTDAS